MTLKVGQPAVNVRIPEIKVPDIKVPESVVNVDTKELAAVLDRMGQAIVALSAQQATILQAIADNSKLIAELAKNAPNVEVKAPVVKLPARPRNFRVEVEDENGDTTYMRIAAESPN